VNRQPFSTLLSAVSRPKPPLVRYSERLVPEQSLSQGAPAGPTEQVQQISGLETRATSMPVVPPRLLETARNSQVPATLGVAGVPVINLPPGQLTSTKDKPNRTIREFARIKFRDSSRNSECRRKLMALENTEQCQSDVKV
jgi:hypothetical protein